MTFSVPVVTMYFRTGKDQGGIRYQATSDQESRQLSQNEANVEPLVQGI